MTLKESSVELYVGETKERVLTPVDNRVESVRRKDRVDFIR